MSRFLRVTAAVACLLFLAFWLLKGANRGWTKTSEPVKTLDPVTGIEGIEYRQVFLPGVDFLAIGLAASGTLAFISIFTSKTKQKHNV